LRRFAPLVTLPLAVLLVVTLLLVASRPRPPIETTHVAASVPAMAPVPSSLAAPSVPLDARVEGRTGRMIHEDPRHTHRARGRAPSHPGLAWKVVTDGPIESQVATSPDGQALYVATLGGSLWAVTDRGEKRFSVALGGRAYSSPLVGDDGTIYVGSDAGLFFAITPAGQVRWRLNTGADADTGAAFMPDGNLVFAAGNAVFGVRPTGDVLFRFVAKGKVFTAPALTDGGRIVFGSQDDHVYALTPAGTLAWATDLGGDVDGAPAVADDGSLYVGCDTGDVVRLDARGEIVWRAHVGGFVRGTLSVARNGDVLAGVYGRVPREVRITPAGVLRGDFVVRGTGAAEFGVHGGALEDDLGTLVFGAQDDRVYAVGSSGTLEWEYLTKGDVDAPMTLLPDGTLVFGSDDGSLYALRDLPGKGQEAGSLDAGPK
jgi:outer membrane protein assembly factor BamB